MQQPGVPAERGIQNEGALELLAQRGVIEGRGVHNLDSGVEPVPHLLDVADGLRAAFRFRNLISDDLAVQIVEDQILRCSNGGKQE